MQWSILCPTIITKTKTQDIGVFEITRTIYSACENCMDNMNRMCQ